MSFKEILAQPVAVRALQNALSGERLSGAYLFAGPEGVGKRFTARQLAKAINCEMGKEDSCDKCLSCRKIDSGNHPDLFWIEPKEKSVQISIEAIRELKKEITLRPWEGKRRVAVILEVERATEEAQNAFLKMLEETPGSTLVLLTSVKVEGVLPTVLSRCKRVHFGPIPSEVIEELLRKEKQISPEAASTLAKLCHGSLGRALLMKENFFEEKSEILDHFLERAFHIDEERGSFEDKEAVFTALDLLASWYRDLWVMKEEPSRKLLFHEDRFQDLEKESSRWTENSLEEALSEILNAREMLDQHVNPKLLLYLLSRKIKGLKTPSQ